jgi:hypothetical protein
MVNRTSCKIVAIAVTCWSFIRFSGALLGGSANASRLRPAAQTSVEANLGRFDQNLDLFVCHSISKTGHFGTVSELKPSHTFDQRRG